MKIDHKRDNGELENMVNKNELPTISIIIATHERPHKIVQLMADIGDQKNAPRFEILICDDGSCDESLQLLNSTCREHGATLLTQENRGFRIARARNMGIHKARNEIALFLDDDVRIPKNFLREVAKIHIHEIDPIVAIGPRLYVPKYLMSSEINELTSLTSIIEDDREKKYGLSFKDERLKKARCPWKVCYTCNLSVRLIDLRAIGGFDESFIGYGLEDNELAYRLFKSGLHFVASHKIPVFHENENNPTDPYKRAVNGITIDFTDYIKNAKKFIEKHENDCDVQRVFNNILDAIEDHIKDEEKFREYQINIW